MTIEIEDIPQKNERQTAENPAAREASVRAPEETPNSATPNAAVAARTYNGHKHRQIGDAEILELLPLVRKIARRAVSYLKPPLSFEDLVSAGTVGLLKAARDFDASHQAQFKSYAFIRIKGAVLDELRRASLLPSGVNRQIRAVRELRRKITEQTGCPPTEEELAQNLGLSVEEVYGLFESARAQQFVSIDTLEQEQPALGDLLTAAWADTPDRLLEKAELVEQLTEALQELDERRLQIVVLYYQQHLTMKQIAEVLEITESRVSQLHAGALFSLSERLEQWKDGR